MSNNIAPTENSFHKNLDSLLQAATDIAVHPDTNDNALVEIIETTLTKSLAKASNLNPLLKSLFPSIKGPYYALMENKHSTPETYNLVKNALKEKQETSKQIQQRATDLKQIIQETENELAELESYYIVEINRGNTDEQLKIEQKTQDLSAKLPTFKMMLKGNEKALPAHQTIIKPLENVLHQERAKYSAKLASPYYKEFEVAQDEFIKAFHKLRAIELQLPTHLSLDLSIPGFTNALFPDQTRNDIFIDKLLTRMNHPSDDSHNKYALKFIEEMKAAFSTSTDVMEFNPS